MHCALSEGNYKKKMMRGESGRFSKVGFGYLVRLGL